MRFTHDDNLRGYSHELRTEKRNGVIWVIHERTCHKTGKVETAGRISFGYIDMLFSTAVSSILNPTPQPSA